LPNRRSAQADWQKLELIYRVQEAVDQESGCLDGAQYRHHRRQFGHIRARLRCHLRRLLQNLAPVNDNFLNFVTTARFDAAEAELRLRQLARTNPKIQQLIDFVEKELGSSQTNFCLSFNGGKDCTVLLHTLATLMPKTHSPLNLLMLRTESDLFADQ